MAADIQLNVDLAIAKALDSRKVPGFTTTNWHKALLSHIQVGNTTQTWLLVAPYDGAYVDVTKHLTGDLDVLPKQDTWDTLKVDKYNPARPWLEGNETDTKASDIAGGSWFAVKSEIDGSRGQAWTYEFDKQVWAGAHQGAPFTPPPSSTKDTKPSAEDWAREFSLYPRRELPEWAAAIVASVPTSVRSIPPVTASGIGTDWSSLRTIIEDEALLWLRFANLKFHDAVKKALGEDWQAQSYGHDLFILHTKGDPTKGFIVRQYHVFDDDTYGDWTWAWASPRTNTSATAPRALFDYGIKNNLLDLTYPVHVSEKDPVYDIVGALATVVDSGVFNYKLDDRPLRPYRVLTKDEATPLLDPEYFPKTYVKLEIPALTFNDLTYGLEDALGFRNEPTDKFRIEDIVKNVVYLGARTNLPVKVDGNEATLSDPDEVARAEFRSAGSFIFTKTDAGYSYTTRNRY
ncbi:hypothetical protein Q8F55_007332 [Vanrija albida]|uniref:Minor tail protein n=1 Tax=Vanrija albida TaxID=181172 RepID=A0ABR3Q052_9TREE